MSASNTTKRSPPSQRRYVAGGSPEHRTPLPFLFHDVRKTLSGGMSSRNCWGPTTPTPPPHVGRRSLSSNE